jgi:hypothetical protein
MCRHNSDMASVMGIQHKKGAGGQKKNNAKKA